MTPEKSNPANSSGIARFGKRFRRRLFAGGFIACVVAVAMFLQGLLNGFGFGNGSGNGNGNKDGSGANALSKQHSEKKTVPIKKTVKEKNPEKALSVLTVLLDGQKFYRQKTNNERSEKMLSIPEIVQLALAATPSKNGVRMEIWLRDTGILDCEDRLRNALRNAGIHPDDVVTRIVNF